MNVTLSLEDQLVKKVRKIAVDRDTTLTGMVREYLKQVAAEEDTKRRQLQALERSFRTLQVKIGKTKWTREELHERG
jgi:predicted transcriptional regulator